MYNDLTNPPPDAVAMSINGYGDVPSYLTKSHYYWWNYTKQTYERQPR